MRGDEKAISLILRVLKGDTRQEKACLPVVIAQPLQEALYCGVPPHPGGEALHNIEQICIVSAGKRERSARVSGERVQDSLKLRLQQ